MNKCIERLYNGIIKENPTFVLILGMCPTLAVTSSLVNGAGMGLSTMAVLVLSNMVISMLRNIIPNGVSSCIYRNCSQLCYNFAVFIRGVFTIT